MNTSIIVMDAPNVEPQFLDANIAPLMDLMQFVNNAILDSIQLMEVNV